MEFMEKDRRSKTPIFQNIFLYVVLLNNIQEYWDTDVLPEKACMLVLLVISKLESSSMSYKALLID